MSSKPEDVPGGPGRPRIILSWTPVILLVWLVAVDSLWQLRHERTRAIPLPISRPIAPEELADARASAETWFVPTLIFLALVSLVTLVSVTDRPVGLLRKGVINLRGLFWRQRWALSMFSVACLLDFVSTLLFCHSQSLLDEMHPAIRLMAYAYGLVVGILMGKLTQAALVLVVALSIPRIAAPLIWTTAIGYFLAAIWNFSWL